MKALNQKRKVCYNGERYHNDLFYKRRKLLDRRSSATSDGVLSSESVSNSPQKDMIGNKNDTYISVHGGQFHINRNLFALFSFPVFPIPVNVLMMGTCFPESGVSSSVFGDQSSFHGKDAHGILISYDFVALLSLYCVCSIKGF